MILTRTPYRISFFGGGTDYPDWYLKEGGSVLSTTIDKYCYISCRVLPSFFDVKHRVVWSHIEAVNSISEILHPAVREGLRLLGFDDAIGLEIHHQGDLPARAGMGSSGAFAVGLIRALMALRGQPVAKHELALRAIELEQVSLRENVGSQDQVAAAHGGLNRIDFETSGRIQVTPQRVDPERLCALQSRLMLYYTGTSRLASEVARTVIQNLGQRTQELRVLREMVDEAESLLAGRADLDGFGKLLHEGWMLKRKLSAAVSNPKVDGIYETALRQGAVGGKLLGAGASGFMLFYVPLERQPAVAAALAGLLRVPFCFEDGGATLIYADTDPSNAAAGAALSPPALPPSRPGSPRAPA